MNKKLLLPYSALFLLALALRLGYLGQWHGTALSNVLIGDGAQYERWAREIAAGDWFGREVFYQAPLYPYFLAAIHHLLGSDLWAVRLTQAVLGSASTVLLALAGRRFFDRRTGLVAGGLLALYGPAIYFDGLVQKCVLDGLFMSALLVTLGELAARRTWRWALATGLVLGGFALTRENALVLPPLAALWLVVGCGAERPRHRLLGLAALCGGVALVLVPIGLRNQALGGSFLPTTAQAGPNFFIGNNPAADGRYRPLRPGRGTAQYERRDATALAERAVGRELTPASVSRYWFGQSAAYIRSDPLGWSGLLARKALLVWHAGEIMDSDSIEAYVDASFLLRTLDRVLNFGVLLPLALVGAWATRNEWRRLWILYAVVLALAGAVALFYVMARYRYPLVPPLALFAAAGLVALERWVQRRALGALGRASVALLLVFAVCHWPLAAAVDPRTITYYSLGTALVEQGRLEEGRNWLERALAHDPRFADAQFKLGDALTRLGRADEALAHLREALRIDPRHADAHTALGNAYLAQGEREQAAAHYRTALELDPESAAAHNNLAILLAEQGDLAGAIAHWERSLAARPEDPSVWVNLGKVLLVQGDAARARRMFEKALALDPAHAEARQWLARATP